MRKLQPAHGGSDPGAVYEGRREKDDNLSLAIAVGELLSRQGVSVIYTRTTDVYQTPFEKAQMANQADADFFISFHRNSSEEPNQYTGVETLVYDNSGIKQTMAENINGALSELGFRNLGEPQRRPQGALPGKAPHGSRAAHREGRRRAARHDELAEEVINSPSRLRRQPPQRGSLLSDRSVKPPSVREVASRKR